MVIAQQNGVRRIGNIHINDPILAINAYIVYGRGGHLQFVATAIVYRRIIVVIARVFIGTALDVWRKYSPHQVQNSIISRDIGLYHRRSTDHHGTFCNLNQNRITRKGHQLVAILEIR